ncbi:type IX secretion system protein PorQ [Prevotellamassilia timonensis]|uniref:type IX secretion system protein PorQ n=1 Tax=Prevotellamassilia timonensis TaxID=1852370 RepID=UPI0023F194E7|nr:type IX secretion system protein PorQ [Prevotellamassilia timonensis]MDD7439302.1 type IX secretion system protein PorQ [Prevotellamassilia timonensis]
MNIKIFSLLLAVLPATALAQEYASAFNTLRLPASSHAAALGGQNVTLIEDEPTAGWYNPALYANVSDFSAGLDFMTYATGSTWMGAHFVKAFGERHTMAVGAQYMNYGKMDETDEAGNTLGQFSAKDIVIGAGYSYLLSDRWTGGANLKMMVSNLADYTALAAAIDVGVNYYDDENDLSVSASLQNIGTQLKAYHDGQRTHLPFTLALGFSKGMAHLPVRFHVTMTDVTRWKSSYYVLPENKDKDKSDKVGFGKKALNHFVLGLDILPTDYLYLSVGYNFRRAYELKASGSSHLAGLSAGAGVNVKHFKFGVSYAKYHQASNSIMANVGYAF